MSFQNQNFWSDNNIYGRLHSNLSFKYNGCLCNAPELDTKSFVSVTVGGNKPDTSNFFCWLGDFVSAEGECES